MEKIYTENAVFVLNVTIEGYYKKLMMLMATYHLIVVIGNCFNSDTRQLFLDNGFSIEDDQNLSTLFGENEMTTSIDYEKYSFVRDEKAVGKKYACILIPTEDVEHTEAETAHYKKLGLVVFTTI